jgi:starch phosphorylase
VDVWLNTPRYPLEASGTSGMKVLVNGGLDLSELDGWWAEGYEPGVGWALGSPDGAHLDDATEGEQLYRLLETEVVPAFYERDPDGLPRAWLARVRASMIRLTPRFSANRLVAEYVEHHYLPAARRARAMGGRGGGVAAEAAASRDRLRLAWGALDFGDTQVRGRGRAARVVVPVRLGTLEPADIVVQLYREPVLAGETDPVTLPMQSGRRANSGWTDYAIALDHLSAPLEAHSARALPREAVELGALALPLIAWQR